MKLTVYVPRVVYDLVEVDVEDAEGMDEDEHIEIASSLVHSGEGIIIERLTYTEAVERLTEDPDFEFGPEYLSNDDRYPVLMEI